MASSINFPGVCARKGDIPVGTGLPNSSFCQAPTLPIDDETLNATPGYTLQSDSTKPNGVSWQYTGANGLTTRSYSFPSNTPTTFPGPNELKTDLVQITREDLLVSESGLIDIAMPVIGIQGKVPTHTLPSLCDATNQLVFFFDDANAAINVYQVTTKTWRMGWMRAVISDTFRWRAASLLLPEYVNNTTAYVAPFDAKGIFFSCVTVRLTNQNQQSFTFDIDGTGFFFANYDTSSGNIIAFSTVIEPVPGNSGDWSVSAIATINQNQAGYRAPTTAPLAKDIVAAVAVSNNSNLTQGLYGWWGFVGKNNTNDGIFLNPDLSIIPTTSALDFCFRSGDNPNYVPTGFVETISYDGALVFFLGGNYSSVRFSNVIVTRAGAGTQKLGVAAQYAYSGTGAMTIDNYQFVGSTVNNAEWSGRVASSNYANGYFAYGGTFLTPPSDKITTSLNGIDPSTATSFNTQEIKVQFTSQDQIVNPRYFVSVGSAGRGGFIDTQKYLIGINSGTFGVTGSAEDYGVCLNLVPNNGDVREGTFPPRFIGGNFLVPSSYETLTSIQCQTQEAIIPNNWWMSYISFYLNEDVSSFITVSVQMNPIGYTGSTDTYAYSLPNLILKKGYNSIPFLSGASGNLYNSHTKNPSSTASITLPQIYKATLTFSTPVKFGVNPGNGNRFIGCWSLEGYPATQLGTDGGAGRFSSVGLLNGNIIQVTTPTVKRVLIYNNTTPIPVPLNTTTYYTEIIPINVPVSAPVFAGVELDGNGISQLTILEDRQGGFKYSCLHNAIVPGVVYEVPTMSNSTGVQPAFSLYMKSKYEIYKTAWANGDDVALGLYTNFQEITAMQYTLDASGSNVSGLSNKFKCAFNNNAPSLPNQLVLNRYNSNNTLFDFTIVKDGDIMELKNAVNGATNRYLITGVTQALTVVTLNITRLDGNTNFDLNTTLLITIALSRNPYQTPFVLKENFGQFVIGNGTSLSRDVYLSPSQPTGKTYRYIPNYESNFLPFDTGVLLPNQTTDDVYEVNTALFNSNGSTVFLKKALNPALDRWIVTNIAGNVGFNTQN
jgi:hypothetical protein